MIFKKIFIISLLLCLSSFTLADQLYGPYTVKRIFSEGTHTGGFYPNEALPECKWSLMYIDLSKESGKAIFSMLLAAKAANQKIVRIDYSVSAGETCMVSGLHVQ